MRNRRQLFREYMAQLSASANPADAIEAGFYVPRPGRALADEIVRRLELQMAGTHLVVGAVGSGKTTELLVAQQKLSTVSDIRTLFIDVSQRHDLARLRAGVLLVLVGLALSVTLTDSENPAVQTAIRRFRQWAHGWTEWIDADPGNWDRDDDPDDRVPIHHEGILHPPGGLLEWETEEKAGQLRTLLSVLPNSSPHVVILFDSLDRLTDFAAFEKVVSQDVRALKSIGIGLVLIGPLPVLYGTYRTLADRFDYYYHQPSVDVSEDVEGYAFLQQVLRRRASDTVLPDVALLLVVQASGGVLRDLISLARAAGEEAYGAGSDIVQPQHVEAAIDAFGRSLMLGLGGAELKTLQRVKATGVFVPTTDRDITLLATRRILEYRGAKLRYAVHPTIFGLLDQVTATP